MERQRGGECFPLHLDLGGSDLPVPVPVPVSVLGDTNDDDEALVDITEQYNYLFSTMLELRRAGRHNQTNIKNR
jgi:hypothetical protein